ncbi:MAG: 2OG-Fe(II) oxygenase [Proteobacteria bacterium]|nr:2OG-Fe(II) oxygenase [Pseudomonadota bacterium]
MTFNLNNKLDAAALGREYQKRGFIQVKDVLPNPAAGELHNCLAKDTPWGLFYFKDDTGERIPPEDFEKMPGDKQQEIFQFIFKTARDGYQFMFFYHPVMQNALAGLNPDFPLHHWFDFINSEPLLDFVRNVTGIPEIVRADCMATRFVGNCFLHCHRDHQEGRTRRVAYVMNLTRDWNPNWGGYLQIFNDKMNIEHSFKPAFNCLNMFTVPRDHSVSTVPPFCPGERLSLTGWFHEA